MLVRIGKHNVEVLDEDCRYRPCFTLGFDKGPFVPGVGYTNPRLTPQPCCFQRHLNGCPTGPNPEIIVCPECNGSGCEWCHGQGDIRYSRPPEPEPCCDQPMVPRLKPGNPVPRRQACRSCGTKLTGRRLELAERTRAKKPSSPQP
jgi:hypothetical protein